MMFSPNTNNSNFRNEYNDDNSVSSNSSTGSDLSFLNNRTNADGDDDSIGSSSSNDHAVYIKIGKSQLDDFDSDDAHIIASLRRELQQLRETTDDEYALAIAMAARDRERFEKQISELTKERDDAKACNKVQQMHINSLTEEVIQLQNESREARETTKLYQKQLQQTQFQMEQLWDNMEKLRKAFEDWFMYQNDGKEPITAIATEETSSVSSHGQSFCDPVHDTTGTSPTCPIGELEKAYHQFSSTVNEHSPPRIEKREDSFPRRSWPEPPNPIKLPFISSSYHNTSVVDNISRSYRDDKSTRVGKESNSRTKSNVQPRRNKSCEPEALLQASFIKEAVKKQRRSTWSNLSLLLRDPVEELEEGNLMGQVVEFRVDPL